jgi:hypothetical protein
MRASSRWASRRCRSAPVLQPRASPSAAPDPVGHEPSQLPETSGVATITGIRPARLREHLALPGCSILRRSCPASGVSGYLDPAGGHEEDAVA